MRAVLLLLLAVLLILSAWLLLGSPEPAAPGAAAAGAAAAADPAAADPLTAPPRSGENPAAIHRDEAGARSDDPAAPAGELAGAIGGLVLDAGGNPLPGASVAFLRRPDNGAFLLGLDPAAPVDRLLRTDAQGRYSVADLPAGGSWDLGAWHADFCFTAGPAVLGQAGAAQELPPIQLGDGYRVEGITVDEQSNPLSGVIVDFQLAGWQPAAAGAADPLGRFLRATSQADGRFEFSGLGDGAWTLRARSPGRGDGWISSVLLLPRQQAPNLRVVLGPEYPLSGAVRTAGGAPVPGASVTLQPGSAGEGPSFETLSDAEGRFSLRGVPEGGWILSASCAGHLPARPQELDSAARADLVLELQAIGGVQGQILDAQGHAPAGATLQLWSTMRGNPPFQPLEVFQPLEDPEGKFLFPLAEPGTFVLLVRAAGCAPVWTEPFQAHAQVTDLGQIRLSPAASVAGRLVAEGDQSAIAGALVSLRSASWDPAQEGGPFAALLTGSTDVPPVSARTAADGSFELAGLPLVPCQLVFEHAGIVTLRVPLQPAAGARRDLGELRAQAACSLTILGLDSDGRPLAGGNALLQRDEAGLNQSSHLLDAAGRVRIGGLAPGDCWVSVVEGGGLFGLSSERQRLFLAPGAHQELELRLEPPR